MFRDTLILGMELYDFFTILSGVLFLFFNFANVNKKKLFLSNASSMAMNYLSQSKFKLLSNVYLWSLLETAVISCIIYLPPFSKSFGRYVGTGTNYLGLLFMMPVVIFVFFYIISVDPRKQMDLITPAFPFALIFTKIGCFCAGCCHGIECSFGMYNQKTELVEFPVQLVETGLALLIFVFILLIRNKAKEGTLFPMYLILYSGTRFFSEFLRHEPDVFWKLKTYHLLCIAGLIVGIVELFIVLKFGAKISKFCTEHGVAIYLPAIFSEIRFKYLKIKKKILKRDGPIVHHKKRKKKNQKKMKNRK